MREAEEDLKAIFKTRLTISDKIDHLQTNGGDNSWNEIRSARSDGRRC
jgi:hypothetical protein